MDPNQQIARVSVFFRIHPRKLTCWTPKLVLRRCVSGSKGVLGVPNAPGQGQRLDYGGGVKSWLVNLPFPLRPKITPLFLGGVGWPAINQWAANRQPLVSCERSQWMREEIYHRNKNRWQMSIATIKKKKLGLPGCFEPFTRATFVRWLQACDSAIKAK